MAREKLRNKSELIIGGMYILYDLKKFSITYFDSNDKLHQNTSSALAYFKGEENDKLHFKIINLIYGDNKKLINFDKSKVISFKTLDKISIFLGHKNDKQICTNCKYFNDCTYGYINLFIGCKEYEKECV